MDKIICTFSVKSVLLAIYTIHSVENRQVQNSPGILSRKVGQPATNCKRRFFNGFKSRNMPSITYQKSPKIRVGEVGEKQVF